MNLFQESFGTGDSEWDLVTGKKNVDAKQSNLHQSDFPAGEIRKKREKGEGEEKGTRR